MQTRRKLAAASVGIRLAAVLACAPTPNQTDGDAGQTEG